MDAGQFFVCLFVFKGSIRKKLIHIANFLIFPKGQFYFLKCRNITGQAHQLLKKLGKFRCFCFFPREIFSHGGHWTSVAVPSTPPLPPLLPTPPQPLGDSGNPTVNDTTSWDVMGVGAAAASCLAGTRTYRNVGRLQRASLSSQSGLGTREEIRDALSSSTHPSR